MNFFTYIKDVRGSNGDVHRVLTEDVTPFMLCLKDGTSTPIQETDDLAWIKIRRDFNDETKFAYAEVAFIDWWVRGLTEAERLEALADCPPGTFKKSPPGMEEQGDLLCSLEDGEPTDAGIPEEEEVKPKKRSKKSAEAVVAEEV